MDMDELSVADPAVPSGSRYAEIYGSPAVAYGRVYFTTEGGIYALGDKAKPFKVTKDDATRRFRAWLAGLWFAPNEVKRFAARDPFVLTVAILSVVLAMLLSTGLAAAHARRVLDDDRRGVLADLEGALR